MWIIIMALISAGICAALANYKNRSWGPAIIWGLLFSWISVLVYLCLEHLAPCPHCKIGIKTNATLCYKCGMLIR